MGNSLPLPCVCQEAKVVATTGAKKERKKRPAPKSSVRAAPRRAVVPVDTPGDGNEEEEEMKRAWPGCRVEPVGEDGVRVKVVMRRKDAAELMARLEERGAVERKARMGELNTELGGGMMSPCRDAWRPRLASIPEN